MENYHKNEPVTRHHNTMYRFGADDGFCRHKQLGRVCDAGRVCHCAGRFFPPSAPLCPRAGAQPHGDEAGHHEGEEEEEDEEEDEEGGDGEGEEGVRLKGANSPSMRPKESTMRAAKLLILVRLPSPTVSVWAQKACATALSRVTLSPTRSRLP